MGKRLGYTVREKSEIRKTLGKNLKAARKNAGLTQSEVMEAIWGTPKQRNRISEIENGHRLISIYDLTTLNTLYGQSLDYIFGLSVEPTHDSVPAMTNHIVRQSRSMVEHLTEQFAGVMVGHMKSISCSSSELLLDAAKQLCQSIQSGADNNQIEELTFNLAQVIRGIESKRAMECVRIEAQMVDIQSRLDIEDGHVMWQDMEPGYQMSLPLPNARFIDNAECAE